MKTRLSLLATLSAGVAIATLCGSASALDFGKLKDMVGGGNSGASSSDAGSSLGSLGSLGSVSSLTSGSLGNVTGIVQYCIQNNYLGGNGASSVKDQLMSKLTGSPSTPPPQSNTDFVSGAKGLLTTGDGKSVDLTGGGLKAQVTKQVCEKVLDQAKSFL